MGLLSGNMIVWLIPSSRYILDMEDKPFPETSYFSSQKALLKIAVYFPIPWCRFPSLGCFFPGDIVKKAELRAYTTTRNYNVLTFLDFRV